MQTRAPDTIFCVICQETLGSWNGVNSFERPSEMAITFYMYDHRDFNIDFKNGDGQTIYTEAPTADDQSSSIPYSQTVTGGTLSMKSGELADTARLTADFPDTVVDTAVSNTYTAVVAQGKTYYGDTVIATGETLNVIYEIRIYDPANPTTQISLYAIARTDTYNGAPADGIHEIVGFASAVPLDPTVNYVVGDVYDNTEPAVRETLFDVSSLTPDPANPVCFAQGTRIETERGEVPIEDLRVGDMVRTSDHGLQPIRWIGQMSFTKQRLAREKPLCPMRINQGALGPGLPNRDLIVSQQHRIIIRSRIAERMFNSREVLIAAKHLRSVKGIDRCDDMDRVTYFHLMFDQHEIIIANGAEAESLFLGAQALENIGAAAREELFLMFPELRNGDTPSPARRLISARRGRSLLERHAKNERPLVSAETV